MYIRIYQFMAEHMDALCNANSDMDWCKHKWLCCVQFTALLKIRNDGRQQTSLTVLLTSVPPTFSSTMTIVRWMIVSMVNVVVTHSCVLAVDDCNNLTELSHSYITAAQMSNTNTVLTCCRDCTRAHVNRRQQYFTSQCSTLVHNTVVRATISQWETNDLGEL